MKKFFATVFLLAAVLAAMKGCQKELPKRGEPIINVPKVSSSTTVEENTNNNTIVTPYGSVSYLDFSDCINETVYKNLKKALTSFETLLKKGSVAAQMENHGTYLSEGDKGFIDDCMGYMYGLICDYVYGYEAQNWEGCMNACREMCDFNFNKSYLFDIMVASKLPWEYNDGTVHVDFSQNIYDGQGNIVMTNGRKLHLIGAPDTILSSGLVGQNMYDISRWYCTIPGMITDQYETIGNINGDNGICHIWNQTNTERRCRTEWNNIKLVGQSMYGCDPKTTTIRWEDSANCYIFVGPNNEVYGPVDYQTGARIDHIFEVQDAIVNGYGDVYGLDSHIQEMIHTEDAIQYHN